MKRALKHLPLNAWPAQDRKAFAILFKREDDLYDDNGPLSHVSPATQRTFTHSYRRWLGYVTKHHPELLVAPPWDRVTPTTIKAFGRHLRETCNPHTVAGQIGNLHCCIRALALRDDWSWLAQLCTRLHQSAGRRPSKPHIPINSAQTLDYGLRLMDEAWQVLRTKGQVDKDTLMTYRDGLVIALLSNCPIRRRNITSIMIDHNLIRQSQGYILQFDRKETKTSNTLLFEVHKDLTIYLDRHLDYVRPHFPRTADHPYLFASFKGVRLGGDQMNIRVKHLMQQEFDIGFTLHDLRRIAATTRSIHDPRNIHFASQLLGHADQSTTDEHYIRASSIMASRAMNRIISKKRR